MRDNVPSAGGQQQDEASLRFDDARRTLGKLLPDFPYLRSLDKANVALGLGVSAWFIVPAFGFVVIMLFPDQTLLGLMFYGGSCATAIAAMTVGSHLGGRNAPVLAARLGYLLGIGWLSLVVLSLSMFYVANGILSPPVR